jgi:Zn-dependent protease with chaperone function
MAGSRDESALPEPMRRRGMDTSSVASLALGLPWFIVSFFLVYLIGEAIAGGLAIVLVLFWLASGAIVFYPPAEYVFARAINRYRRPTAVELERLSPAWDSVTNAARVDKSKYSLWIQDADQVNAFAAAGHIVGVTRWALYALPTQHLAAVLAHELGHHLRGHAWAGLLSYWYSLPGRFVYRVAMFVLFVGLRVMAAFSCLGFLIAISVLAILLAAFAPFLLPFIVVPPLLAYFSRLGEKQADRVAAELGYGQLLIQVHNKWIAEGHDIARDQAGWRARLMASHPSDADRIRALEAYLRG